MVHHRTFFKAFLIVYGGFLLVHVWEMGFGSWQVVAGLLGGLAAAYVAHRKHGYIPTAFLVSHMAIEWYHHAQHGNHYGSAEILFCGIHAVLDIVFLTVEVREHCGKYAYLVLATVAIAIAGIFWHYYVPAVPPSEALTPLLQQALEVQKSLGDHHHGRDGEALGALVVGGVLGCILFQLLNIEGLKHSHKH